MSNDYDYQCPHCGAVFNGGDDLDSDGETIVCPACGLEFDRNEDDQED